VRRSMLNHAEWCLATAQKPPAQGTILGLQSFRSEVRPPVRERSCSTFDTWL
jgi:hypothetical protein